MRHFILSGTVLTGSLGMLESTREAVLIALTSRTLRFVSSELRTALGTIDLTTITIAADEHLRATARTQIESGGRVHSNVLANHQNVDEMPNAWDTSPAFVLSTMWGTAPIQTCW